ncbi:MAG: 50S ribosomal protein L30 [Candidatus Melainabacteria bacterium]|jgi:large subunit ribosomal protein L30|nr:50S ribosomal protein L30 [Candidatus Melainabacteria bacterium]
MLKITLTRGLVGKKETQKKVVQALGLGKYGSSVVHADSPTIRGMVTKISHLVSVETVEGGEHKPKAAKAKKPAAKAPAKAAAKSKAKEE